MKDKYFYLVVVMSFILIVGVSPAFAASNIQCPGDTDGDAVIDSPDSAHPDAVCMHLGAGDGFIRMADGRDAYIFGFVDMTGVPENMAMEAGMLKAAFTAPTIVLREGQEFYLTLTNVGMMMRPDLFDPHTVHFHGFPNASAIFDGEPMASVSINMGSSFTYYYNIVEPGTHMYHCHVEATEHMQMGMLGNLYVLPAQDGTVYGGCASATYAYNDGDGTTCYDIGYPVQLNSFDMEFHDASINVQPLPFAMMNDTYAMFNGRGYPDTVNPDIIYNMNGDPSQPLSSRIEAYAGQKILLRLSSLSTTDFYTVSVLGIPMKVIGSGARQLRGPDPDGSGPMVGKDLHYETNSVTLGGGQAMDVILDTAGVAPGTYFIYTTNLNHLSNGEEDFGGMMTEIVIN